MGWENPVTWVVVPGLFGGLLMAFVIGALQRRGRSGGAERAFDKEPLSTDVINMARIRVAGIGGLGLVAMAAVVALNVPEIGRPIAVGATLGVACGAMLIVWRSRKGPLPSSAEHGGANTTLSIDAPRKRKAS